MTIQHKECFYSRLTHSPTWKTRQEKGVLFDDVDELFNSGHWSTFKKILTDKKQGLDYAKEYYFQHEKEMQYPLLWQDYWDCLDLAQQYYENPISFKQEMQGDVDNIGEKRFKTIITETPEEIESHTFNKTILSVDPAGTSRKGKKHDYYAFVVGSLAENKIIYARKSELFDFEYEDYINHTLFLLHEYSDIQYVSIEKNVYSRADVLKMKEKINNDDELKHRHIEFINEHRSGNKDDRINTIVGRVNLGQVIFNEEDKEAIQQLSDFCGTKFSLFDDYPDVLADCIQRLDEVKIIKPIRITPNWFL